MYNTYNNPYFNPSYRPIEPQFTPIQQNVQPIQQNYSQQPQIPQKQAILQGKQVESIDIVNNIEIPWDGSISYFPLMDNSAIVTKQLNADGSKSIVIYKPVAETEKKEEKKEDYITLNQLKEVTNEINENIKNINIPDFDKFSNDLEEIKSQIKDRSKGR